jgi:hypothetical protein
MWHSNQKVATLEVSQTSLDLSLSQLVSCDSEPVERHT